MSFVRSLSWSKHNGFACSWRKWATCFAICVLNIGRSFLSNKVSLSIILGFLVAINSSICTAITLSSTLSFSSVLTTSIMARLFTLSENGCDRSILLLYFRKRTFRGHFLQLLVVAQTTMLVCNEWTSKGGFLALEHVNPSNYNTELLKKESTSIHFNLEKVHSQVTCIVLFYGKKTSMRNNKKQTLSVNRWKHSQACRPKKTSRQSKALERRKQTKDTR